MNTLSSHHDGAVPADPANIRRLIEDYNAHRDVIEAHARELQRVRTQLEQSAESVAREVVSKARQRVSQAMAQARGDLRAVLEAVQTARKDQTGASADIGFIDDMFAQANRELLSMSTEVHAELRALDAETEAVSIAAQAPVHAAVEPSRPSTTLGAGPSTALEARAPVIAATSPASVADQESELDPNGGFSGWLDDFRQSDDPEEIMFRNAALAMEAAATPMPMRGSIPTTPGSSKRVLIAVALATLAAVASAGWWWLG